MASFSARLSGANRGNQAIEQERWRALEHLLQSAGFIPLDNRRILDIGCGSGKILAGFESWGAKRQNLFGVDLLADRIKRAKEQFPEITFRETNAEALPFVDGSFDLVAVFTVFSSILDDQMARNITREINRVLRSGGAVVWYDFRLNNPFNPQVRGIPRQEVASLFPGFAVRLVTTTLLPPLARRLGPLTDRLYACLASLRCLRTHYLGVLVKP